MLSFLLGCKDDDDTSIEVPAEDVFTLTCDSVQMEFHLLNERGDTTTVFNEEEDIIFDLKLVNQSKVNRTIGRIHELFPYGLFQVYNSDGLYIGRAYSFPEELYGDGDKNDGPFYLFPHFGSLQFQCSWNENNDKRTNTPFQYNSRLPRLNQGDYYTTATVRIGKILKGLPSNSNDIVSNVEYVGTPFIITCSIHFQIK